MMNLTTVAHYLHLGYRIRRTCWEPDEYMYEIGGMLQKMEAFYHSEIQGGALIEKRSLVDSNIFLMLGDLLADDWEIITTGIRKQFNKYGNFEYQDEPDWDNYVCRGWGEEDE